jgi:hypothetical protein
MEKSYKCPQHGVISFDNLLKFEFVIEEGITPILEKHYYCPKCFTTMLDMMQEQGVMSKISETVYTN